MRTTASVSRTHALDGVSRDHHRMCSRHLRLRRKSTRGEGAARAQRDAELEADQEVHVAELVFLLVLLLLLHPLLLLPPSTRACLRLRALASPPLPPASRALPLARRPGPELELRFSRRRGGAQRSNCSQRHSYRQAWGRRGGGRAPPPRPAFAGLAHQRPGPELKLRLSHRRVGAERDNCSHRQP